MAIKTRTYRRGKKGRSVAKLDQWNVTLHEVDALQVCGAIEAKLPFALVEPDLAKRGYRTGVVFKHGGESAVRVWWDGNPGVHVICHNEYSGQMVECIRGLGGHLELSRGDSAEDFTEAGGFDRLAAFWIPFAEAEGLKIDQLGDWVRGKGRTLYIGSRSSVAFLRIYEKGHKEGGDPNWVRMEVEVKPKGRTARTECAAWHPGEYWGASRWLVKGLEMMGWGEIQRKAVGTVYRPSNDERARLALMKQYGAIISRWYDECGRDPVQLVAELLELVE